MELKQVFKALREIAKDSFNRTFMELKLAKPVVFNKSLWF